MRLRSSLAIMQNASVSDAPARADAYAPPAAMTAPTPRPEPRDPVARILPAVAVVVLLLSLLPVATLVPGGFESSTWALQAQEWGFGTAIVAGLALVASIFWRRLAPPLGVAGEPAWLRPAGLRQAPLIAIALAVASFALSVSVADGIAGRQSMQIDEIAQTMQARTFVAGHLTASTPVPVEFFATQHMLYSPRGTFSQFPPGGPAAIALGILGGAEWLTGPVFALLALLAWGAWLRATGEPRGTALLAFAILALSPFAFFMGGTRMNHVPAAALVLGASAALATVARHGTSRRARALLALACGLGYGLAATVRPLDAAAFAIPGAVWLLVLAARDLRRPAADRDGRLADLLLSGLGVAAPLALLLWFNAQTTGHPLLFGYQLLWGKAHDLGFHPAPWGTPHTPARGLELVSLYLFQLQRNFLETPVPSLLAALGAWCLVRRTSAADRYLLGSGLLTLLAYWAYWHEGYFLGPRFLYPVVPLFALWTARFPALAHQRLHEGGRTSAAWRPLAAAMGISLAIAFAYTIPMRWMQYRETFGVFRWNAARAAREAGVRNALVLVRDGWESQLVVRQWTLGMGHAQADLFNNAIDACRLDHALSTLERAGADSATTARHLAALTADSAQVQVVRLESGANVRVQPGVRYTPACMQRVAEIERGIVALAPILAQGPADGNVYARDLHARDTLLVAHYPGRPIWLLVAESAQRNARPRYFKVDPDSLRQAWAAEAAGALQEPERAGR
jgi:4-amino-4-deoxy-L-arabinose transferase-like glycosyltransferase